MAVRIRLRYDDKAVWESSNATLARGEFAVVNDNGTISVYVGDSDELKLWSECPVISSSSEVFDGLDFTGLSQGDILYYDGTSWTNRRIVGGNKINVRENNDGNLEISVFDTVFSIIQGTPVATPSSGFSISGTDEVGTPWTGSLSFSGVLANPVSTPPSTVEMCDGTVNIPSTRIANSTANYSLNIDINSGGTGFNIGSVTTASDLSVSSTSFADWFTPAQNRITLTTTGVACATDKNGNVLPSPLPTSSIEVFKQYGWRFWGFTSVSPLSLQDLQDKVTAGTLTTADNSIYSSDTGSTLIGLITNPTTLRTISWGYNFAPIDGSATASRYLYFLCSTPRTGGVRNFSWNASGGNPGNPVFFPSSVGGNIEDGFELLGALDIGSDYSYSVYRLETPQEADSNQRVVFRVQ